MNEEIGEGAFGKVFKATYKPNVNSDERKLIAIKMIKNENRDTITQEFLYDFDREVKILSKFKHKNIIEFLGVVRLDSTKLSFSMVRTSFYFLSLLKYSNVQLKIIYF